VKCPHRGDDLKAAGLVFVEGLDLLFLGRGGKNQPIGFPEDALLAGDADGIGGLIRRAGDGVFM